MCLFLSDPQSSVDEEPEEMPPPDAETVQVISGSELIWKITPRPKHSAKVREELERMKEQFVLIKKKSDIIVSYFVTSLSLVPLTIEILNHLLSLSCSTMHFPHLLCT